MKGTEGNQESKTSYLKVRSKVRKAKSQLLFEFVHIACEHRDLSLHGRSKRKVRVTVRVRARMKIRMMNEI